MIGWQVNDDGDHDDGQINPCLKRDMNPRSQCPSNQDLCLRLHSTGTSTCCFVWYFLVQVLISKHFTISSKWCQSVLKFENKHTFCLWIHHAHTCTAYEQLTWAVAKLPEWPWLKCHDVVVETIYYMRVDLLPTSFLDHNIWLLIGCILNGTLCIK
jgi:hypothetical protein